MSDFASMVGDQVVSRVRSLPSKGVVPAVIASVSDVVRAPPAGARIARWPARHPVKNGTARRLAGLRA